MLERGLSTFRVRPKKLAVGIFVSVAICACLPNGIQRETWWESRSAGPEETFVSRGITCHSDADCASPLTCRMVSSARTGQCARHWRPWDAPVVTTVNCKLSQSGGACGLSYVCFPFYSQMDQWRCAYLPAFVWPPGTGIERGVESELAQTAQLPLFFPKSWDVRKGQIPPAPDGYVWTNGRVKFNRCGYCGLQCTERALKLPLDEYYTYYLQYGRTQLLFDQRRIPSRLALR